MPEALASAHREPQIERVFHLTIELRRGASYVASGCSVVSARVCVPEIKRRKPGAPAERTSKFAQLLLRHENFRVPGRRFVMFQTRIQDLNWSDTTRYAETRFNASR